MPWDLVCLGGSAGEAIANQAVEQLAASVGESVGQAVGGLGTMWVLVQTPVLTGSGSTPDLGPAPGTAELTTVLGYLTWVGFALAALSGIVLGILLTRGVRRGQGTAVVDRWVWIAGGTLLIGAAGGLVGALMPARPANVAGAAAFLQSGLWWLTGALVVLSVIVGGIRLVADQRAEGAKDLLRSLLTFILVTGMATTVIGLLAVGFDQWSVWLLGKSLSCDVEGSTACFGENVVRMLGFAQQTAAETATGVGLAPVLAIVVGIVAIFAALFQVVMMIGRGAMLVVLTGVMPTLTAATNTEAGKSGLKKVVAWTAAFLLYKPAAAILYAAGFQLVGQEWVGDDVLTTALAGLLLMALSLVALPALMRALTPIVGAVAGGAGAGAMAAGAAAALPTGAAGLSRLFGGGKGGDTPGRGETGPSGSSDEATGSAPGTSGKQGAEGAPNPADGGGNPAPTGPGPNGAPAAAPEGAPGEGSKGEGASAPQGAPASGDTPASTPGPSGGAPASPGGGAAGGGAAGGAAAGAGPVGIGVQAAAQAAGAAKQGLQQMGDDVSGEGGPSGSQ